MQGRDATRRDENRYAPRETHRAFNYRTRRNYLGGANDGRARPTASDTLTHPGVPYYIVGTREIQMPGKKCNVTGFKIIADSDKIEAAVSERGHLNFEQANPSRLMPTAYFKSLKISLTMFIYIISYRHCLRAGELVRSMPRFDRRTKAEISRNFYSSRTRVERQARCVFHLTTVSSVRRVAHCQCRRGAERRDARDLFSYACREADLLIAVYQHLIAPNFAVNTADARVFVTGGNISRLNNPICIAPRSRSCARRSSLTLPLRRIKYAFLEVTAKRDG